MLPSLVSPLAGWPVLGLCLLSPWFWEVEHVSLEAPEYEDSGLGRRCPWVSGDPRMVQAPIPLPLAGLHCLTRLLVTNLLLRPMPLSTFVPGWVPSLSSV